MNLGNLENYAEQLRQSGEQSGANLITNALNIPDESYVYVLDDQVVVTCWGFSNAENSLVKDGDIVGRIKEKQETEKVISFLSMLLLFIYELPNELLLQPRFRPQLAG